MLGGGRGGGAGVGLVVALVCLLFSTGRGAQSETIRMLDTRGDYVPNTDSDVAELNSATLAEDPTAALPDQFTICSSGFLANTEDLLWVQVLKEDLSAWSLPMGRLIDSNKFDTEDIVHQFWISINKAYYPLGYFGPLRYNRWIHMCVGIDLATGLVSPVVDGMAIPEIMDDILGQGRPHSLAGRIVIGKYLATSGIWVQYNQLISNINVFGRKLSLDEMIAITAGADCGLEGDYLAWREMKWEVRGPAAIWRNVSKEELCSRNTDVRFINTAGSTHAGARR
jgi:hypothetical protein